MSQTTRARAELMPGARGPEAEAAPRALPVPTGVFQIAEMLEKRTCALCPSGVDHSVLYFARSENIAAHEKCLLYSSALVECEDYNPHNPDRSFDVQSVKKEIKRGRKLKCTFCGQKGATVGCDLKSCAKNYHFFCAIKDQALPQADGSGGTYKLLCQQHASKPEIIIQSAGHSRVKKKRGRKRRLSSGIPTLQTDTMKYMRFIKQAEEKPITHTDATVRVPFLKKCKEVGLLTDLFEEILDKLHLIQGRLMDETTSESDYEEIGTSLFDCRLFEDTLTKFQDAITDKIHQSEEKRQQLKEEIEVLQDLKETLYSFQENRDLNHSSSTSVSSPSP
uniref:PHD finger protein 11 n=1 Tax=Jaculus jaculus TaxID=51337 RepID=UPI001E1B1E1A|nr:PHD finger protein 11 [Jaculus jaculus]